MTDIQSEKWNAKEFILPAKFVQITPGKDVSGQGLYALDEDGVVWKYEDEGTSHRTGEPTDAGWRPISMVRYPKLPSTRELMDVFRSVQKPKEGA